jgi:hypothetical protein
MPEAALKEKAGYVAATRRDRCANCLHCEPLPTAARPFDNSQAHCGKHGFRIKAGAICASYERNGRAPL